MSVEADETDETDDLVRRAAAGEGAALADLFGRHRDRLRAMVRLRMDRRLQGRVDPSDILQEAFVDLAEKLPDYVRERQPALPLFLWMRLVVGERLLRVHRHHLGAAMRDAGREVSIHRGGMPQASSVSLAAQLLGQYTSASLAAARAEMQALLQEALDLMEPADREVVALRHFEELSNDEVAAVLGISKAAASKRYVRAMLRLKQAARRVPGLADPSREPATPEA